MQGTARLGIMVGARYRTVPEAQIVELLVLHGWAHRIRDGDRAAAMEEAQNVLDRCVQTGLPFERKASGDRRFDPAEVVNTIKWASLHRGDPFWQECCVATSRKLVCEFHAIEDTNGVPPPPTGLGAQRFSVALQREFNVQGCRPGKSIRLRLPLPLEGPALHDLEIVSTRSSSIGSVLTVGPGRLDAQLSSPTGTVTLGAELSFVAYPTVPVSGSVALTPDERELYTRPREGIIHVDARIRELAAEIAGSVREPWAVMQRFWSFMLDRLICGLIHYDEFGTSNPLDRVLDSGWYDCRLGSALLIALSRARGFAARMASGYVLYSASTFYHYWMEVWIADRGWVPLDLFCADLSAMGRDKRWRNYFMGCLDYRMKTQCLPRFFDSSPSLRLPPHWHTLARPLDHGVEIGLFENGSGALIYQDRISVCRTPN